MSDYIVKIIPKDPFIKIPMSYLEKAKIYIEERIHCQSIDLNESEFPQFIDCGSEL